MSVKIGVFQGISEKQIEELIRYSNTDPDIVKFTHDGKRFKNRKTFNKWLPGKQIYTLTGGDKELLGISWFDKKNNAKATGYNFTFAIRIYPPVRGHGYSEKLMRSAFSKFIKSGIYKKSPKKGFWLATRKENLFAIRLYEKFGFRRTGNQGAYFIMTFSP